MVETITVVDEVLLLVNEVVAGDGDRLAVRIRLIKTSDR